MIAVAAHTKPSIQRGFDFGTSFNVAVSAVPKFAEHLNKAGAYGCAYGHHPVQVLQTRIPSISIIGRDADALRQAFTEFHEWAQGSDDDAVALHFIFLKSGGYLLAITPEHSRWIARTTEGDPLLDPFLLMLSWVKPIDTVHPGLRSIRKYHTGGFVAPIVFDAAVNQSGIVGPAGLSSVDGIVPLIKFKWNFVDEDEADDPTAWMILRLHRRSARQSSAQGSKRERITPPERTKLQWSRKRSLVLDQVFPVTCARLHRSPLWPEIKERLAKTKILDWQVEQAVANLILSREIADGQWHYVGLGKEDLQEKILQGVRHHVEISDSHDTLNGVEARIVIDQIALDIRYLLRENAISAKQTDLKKLQDKLVREGFADEA